MILHNIDVENIDEMVSLISKYHIAPSQSTKKCQKAEILESKGVHDPPAVS
jgi:hypothetical protein